MLDNHECLMYEQQTKCDIVLSMFASQIMLDFRSHLNLG